MHKYSYITASAAVKSKLSQVMRALGVYYEVSGYGDCHYFNIVANTMQAAKINNYLDELETVR